MSGTLVSDPADESALIASLRAGDQAAFASLVDRHTPALLRVAGTYVPSREIAEEVVQETWIALLKGIGRFEGRSSLRTWLFAVMINIAKARGVRERRDADAAVAAFTGGTVDPDRFRPDGDRWPGHWKQNEEPSPFPDTPEGSLLGDELVAVARRELEKLPERQRIVVTLRDMLGFDSAEVCEMLDISVANQRVLLHRGRAVVRQALEDYLGDVSPGPMDCNELVELVTAYLDGALDDDIRGRFDAHLAECDGCENYLQQFNTTVRTLGKVRDDELDPTFRHKLLDAFGDFG